MATRVRSVGAISTGAVQYPGTPWALRGNVWTQYADETDLLVGEVEVRYPTACDVTPPSQPTATVRLSLGGDPLGSAYAYFYPGAPAQRIGVYFYPGNALLGPNADLTRVVTANVMDSCTGAGQDFTFDNLKIDVIAAS
jgi:hypothetical protein